MTSLSMDRVKKGFGPRCVIRDASARLEEGAHLLEGPNGAGKSTLMSMVAGMSQPLAGSIILDGHDVSRRTGASRRAIAFSAAEPAFFEGVTVAEAIRLHCALRGDPVDRSTMLGEDPFLLDSVMDARFGELSLGWRKRAILHMVLGSSAELVILDEPTVGLDVASIDVLREWLIRRRGIALVTCHEPSALHLPWAGRHVLCPSPTGSVLRHASS